MCVCVHVHFHEKYEKAKRYDAGRWAPPGQEGIQNATEEEWEAIITRIWAQFWETVEDRGAWRTTVPGVAMSPT